MPRRATLFGVGLLALTVALAWAGERARERRAAPATSFALVLAPPAGSSPEDGRVRTLQARVAAESVPGPRLEALGWAFAARARAAGAPADWHLALECARLLGAGPGVRPDAELLAGHALHALHRFAEAERAARAAVERRGIALDYGLLGDVLLDTGRTGEAAAAYQRMMDLRPDSHAYARAGELRWTVGDVEGAREALATATRAASPRNAESYAWLHARLGALELERGDLAAAEALAALALEVQPDSAPALLLRGRALLARERSGEALAPLRAAARRAGTPDAFWALAEAARAAGRPEEAARAEAELVTAGRARDPRGAARFLAATARERATALALAEAELARRRDATTLSVLALAEARAGRLGPAREHLAAALGFGAADARLAYEAGLVAELLAEPADARRHFERAARLAHALFPSERAALARRAQSRGA